MTMLNTGGHGVRRLPAFQMQGRPSDYAIKPIDWGGAIDGFQKGQDRARLRRLQEIEEEGANVRLRELQRAEEAALAEEERMAQLGEHWEGLAGEHGQNQMRSGFDFDAVDPETGQVGVPLGGWDDPQAPSLTGDPRQDQVTKELVEMAKLDPTIFQDTKRLKGFLDQKMQSWAQEDQLMAIPTEERFEELDLNGNKAWIDRQTGQIMDPKYLVKDTMGEHEDYVPAVGQDPGEDGPYIHHASGKTVIKKGDEWLTSVAGRSGSAGDGGAVGGMGSEAEVDAIPPNATPQQRDQLKTSLRMMNNNPPGSLLHAQGKRVYDSIMQVLGRSAAQAAPSETTTTTPDGGTVTRKQFSLR